MYAENLFAAANIRKRHYNAAIKASWPQQRGIKHVWAVRGSNQDYAFVRFKAIHLHQELVQRLFALIVSAAKSGAAMASDTVNFVNEDDARSIFLALFKQIADTACAPPYDPPYQLRTRNTEKRNLPFPPHSPAS